MNFHSLDYFLVLAREKNFTRAAEALHITQQSLSSHIAGLEKELGCTLLVRRRLFCWIMPASILARIIKSVFT